MIEISTDNKNRTASEIRNIMDKRNGRLGESGSVAWMFEKKGQLIVDSDKVDEERLMNLVLESGAEDMRTEEGRFEVLSSPGDFEAVRKAVEEAGITVVSAEVAFLPQSTVSVEGKDAERVLKLIEALEDHEDVQAIHSNFDISDEVLDKLGTL